MATVAWLSRKIYDGGAAVSRCVHILPGLAGIGPSPPLEVVFHARTLVASKLREIDPRLF